MHYYVFSDLKFSYSNKILQKARLNQYSVPFAAIGGLGFGFISFLLGLHHQRILIGHRSDIDKLKVDLAWLTARIESLGLENVAGELFHIFENYFKRQFK